MDAKKEIRRVSELPTVSVDMAEHKDADAITVTKDAANHIREQIKKRGTGIGVKVGVKEVGCSGMMYVVDFIDDADNSDFMFPIDNAINIYVDQNSFTYLKGTRMDYVRKGLNENFEFYNPNSKSTCGCGESFTV